MNRILGLACLFALAACGQTKEQRLAQCNLSGEKLFVVRPFDEAALEDHVANCMTVSGYTLIAAKIGDRTTILDVCERGQSVALKRNVAVHGNWTRAAPNGEARAVSWFKIPEGERLSILPISEVPSLLRETAAIGLKLYLFLAPRALLGTSLDRRP